LDWEFVTETWDSNQGVQVVDVEDFDWKAKVARGWDISRRGGIGHHWGRRVRGSRRVLSIHVQHCQQREGWLPVLLCVCKPLFPHPPLEIPVGGVPGQKFN